MKIKNVFLVFLLLLAVAVLFFYQEKTVEKKCGNLTIYVINASQADAVLIITPQNKTILIDSGSAITKNSSTAVVNFLKKHDITSINILIATHYHEDHIGGVPLIFKNFEVEEIYENGNCGDYSSASQREFQGYVRLAKHFIVTENNKIKIDQCIDAKLIAAYSMMGCQPSKKDSSLENENSLALHITYGNTSFLFAGDCGEKCENELSKRSDIAANVLKINHHGSETSSTMDFLAKVNATYFVLSVNKDRSAVLGYYHPRRKMLSRIHIVGARAENFFRTDLNGDIMIVSNGKEIRVQTPYAIGECQLFSGYASNDIFSYWPIEEIKEKCASNLN